MKMRSYHGKRGDKAAVESSGGKAAEAVSGLCVNCALRDTCTFPGRSSKPVFHCEEYRCEGASCVEAPPARISKPKSDAPREAADLKGLCMNCENRFDCTLPRPPGGVWHCEEYK